MCLVLLKCFGIKIDEFVKLKYILYEKGALDIVPEFETSSVDLPEETGGVDINSSIEEVIREHIGSIKMENIDNKKLLKIFDEVSSIT